MNESRDDSLRERLAMRREALVSAKTSAPNDEELIRLLEELDAAEARLGDGTYGICEECGDPIEPERLQVDPVGRFCIAHLPAPQQAALEADLVFAGQIQAGLLPPPRMEVAGWETSFLYEPAGIVSGDYCDGLDHDGELHFILGDVSGKGVSAALLMAHLHATFRPLVEHGLPLDSIMERASRMFCESTSASLFATLVYGRANEDGRVLLSSAGHNPALVSRGEEVFTVGATGLPLGMFCDEEFSVSELVLGPGDCLFLYTDGLTEAVNHTGEQYGVERLTEWFKEHRKSSASELVNACRTEAARFRGDGERQDDLTVMVVRRQP